MRLIAEVPEGQDITTTIVSYYHSRGSYFRMTVLLPGSRHLYLRWRWSPRPFRFIRSVTAH